MRCSKEYASHLLAYLEQTVEGSLLLVGRDAIRQGQGSFVELNLQHTELILTR